VGPRWTSPEPRESISAPSRWRPMLTSCPCL
jgi:hypothetical protein